MTPLGYSIYWDLPVLIVVVSLVYSATRFDDRGAILREAVRWGGRMVTFLGGIGAALYFLAWWVNSGLGWWVPAVVGGVAAAVALVVAVASKPKTSPG
jgi:hypothetical protein